MCCFVVINDSDYQRVYMHNRQLNFNFLIHGLGGKTPLAPPGYGPGRYRELKRLYPQHIPIYTDGSQQNNHTAAAVVFKTKIISKRLPNLATVYTAELYAILLALTEISKQQDIILYHIIFFRFSLQSTIHCK